MKTYQFFTILITVCSILNTQAQTEVKHTDNIQLDTFMPMKKRALPYFFQVLSNKGSRAQRIISSPIIGIKSNI